MGTQNRVQPPGLGLERRDGDICWVTAESAWPCPVLDLSGQNCFRSYSFIWGEGAPRGSSLHPVPVPTSHLAPFIISSSPCGGGPQDKHKYSEIFRAWILFSEKPGISQRRGLSWACLGDHSPSETDPGRRGQPSVRRKAPGVRALQAQPLPLRHSPSGGCGRWRPFQAGLRTVAPSGGGCRRK